MSCELRWHRDVFGEEIMFPNGVEGVDLDVEITSKPNAVESFRLRLHFASERAKLREARRMRIRKLVRRRRLIRWRQDKFKQDSRKATKSYLLEVRRWIKRFRGPIEQHKLHPYHGHIFNLACCHYARCLAHDLMEWDYKWR